MTSPSGDITFNSSTGHDSNSSGLGPTTAVNDTTESTTASFSGATITFSGATDLSGVSAGDLLYLVTTSGRKFSIIASVNDGADSLTTDDSDWAGTTSGLSWAIGGKRATFDDSNSRQLFTDAVQEWTIVTETNQNITTNDITLNNNLAAGVAFLTIKGDSTTTLRTISQAANDACFVLGGSNYSTKFENLKFENSNVTKTAAYGVRSSRTSYFINCQFGDATNTLLSGLARNVDQPEFHCIQCTFVSCTSHAINTDQNTNNVSCYGCSFGDNTGSGIKARRDLIVINCEFYTNEHSIEWDPDIAGKMGIIIGNTFHDSNADNFEITGTNATRTIHLGNIYNDSGAFGIDAPTNFMTAWLLASDYNNFFNSTSGHRNNVDAGTNDITTDPLFTNEASDDYSLQSSSGAKGTGWPAFHTAGGSRDNYPDIGAHQREEAAGGVSLVNTRRNSLIGR